MNDSLTSRVGRIISGGLNAIVDAMENSAPDMVMEQVLREIDGAIDDVRAELGRVAAGKHLASTRLREENQRYEALNEQIDTAVAGGRDDLAEAGIAEQLDIEAQIPVLERAVAEADEKEKELEGYIQALQARKRELKTELNRFVESRREAEAGIGQVARDSGEGVAARVAKAESAFDRVLEKQTGIASGKSGGDADRGAKLAELEQLARDNRIKERLAAVKSRSNGD